MEGLIACFHRGEDMTKWLAIPKASIVRLQIESALAHRIPSALTLRPRIIRPVAPKGIAAVDKLMDGGLPIGALTWLEAHEM
jgi:recombination protein RecA